jgi:hypothetical protein
MSDDHRYLCDIPEPDGHGRIIWPCAVCVVLMQHGGPDAQHVPVTVKDVKIPGGWVSVPVCESHRDPPAELRQAALILMFMEQKFKANGGQPLTENDMREIIRP